MVCFVVNVNVIDFAIGIVVVVVDIVIFTGVGLFFMILFNSIRLN